MLNMIITKLIIFFFFEFTELILTNFVTALNFNDINIYLFFKINIIVLTLRKTF